MMPLTLACASLLLMCVCWSVALCPPRCVCSGTPLTVRCSPAELPGQTGTLSRSGDSLQQLQHSGFRGLRNATLMELSHNRISEIGSHAFSSLLMLRSLILNNNPLVLIHPEAFSIPGSPLVELSLRSSLYNHTSLTDLITALRWGELFNLQRLDLSSNRLVLLPPGMFTPLPKLQYLYLNNNSLVAVYNCTFTGVENLLELDLSRNAFKTISGEGLHELERLSLVRLMLSQNPYTCTCEMHEFVHWLNSSKVKIGDVERLSCEFPSEMRNVSLRVINARALGCYGETQKVNNDLSLHTSYVFLGLVLGFVGMVFLFVVYLNRKGIKKWITDIHEACRDVLEGYHYRYELDSDPRLGHVSNRDSRLARVPTDSGISQIPSDVTL
ncbi:trophoblast glycoprotein-like [Danio aesculapii]|uniref:trophoblast glycoprotein-like n=1 Tax=Danio aesculapii TaxID=1142201 RepID=UPI0024C04B1F|nr:trophoblast glycoprotein-like [Danio aesculapii]